ncbi:hypothetical protein Syun_016628 [Stephania yunnanensis]|uniref:PX domain-containing protein n=1 Tax=Stephania yunnanensis TaxID=152371 RepID=A0AAP0J7U3_9MAGN
MPSLSVSVTDPVKLGNGVQAYISYESLLRSTQATSASRIRCKTLSIELRSLLCNGDDHNGNSKAFDDFSSLPLIPIRFTSSLRELTSIVLNLICSIEAFRGPLKALDRVPATISIRFRDRSGEIGEWRASLHLLRVITKTNLPEYQGSEKIVIRRYSDFVWLRDRLFEKYKGIFIPPLPEKSAVEKFRFSAEFIEMRRQGLDVFVNRIALHPELQKSDDLRIFLQADEETMERARSQDIGIFIKKPADLMQIFKDVQSKVSDVVLGKEKPVEESNPAYEKLKHYIFELENHLQKHRSMLFSLADFGKAVKLLSSSEQKTLGKAFSDLGTKAEMLSAKLQKEAHNLLMNFEEPLKDYVRAVQSIKVSVFFYDKLMLTRSEKVGEAEIEYKELKVEGEEATRRFETIVHRMNEEIVHFQEQKTLDLGLAFHEFAKGQAQLANEIADAWRSLLPKLEACSSTHT